MSQRAINGSNHTNQNASQASEQMLRAKADDLWTPSQKRAMRLVSKIMVRDASRMSRMGAKSAIRDTIDDGQKEQRSSFRSLFKKLVKR